MPYMLVKEQIVLACSVFGVVQDSKTIHIFPQRTVEKGAQTVAAFAEKHGQ